MVYFYFRYQRTRHTSSDSLCLQQSDGEFSAGDEDEDMFSDRVPNAQYRNFYQDHHSEHNPSQGRKRNYSGSMRPAQCSLKPQEQSSFHRLHILDKYQVEIDRIKSEYFVS